VQVFPADAVIDSHDSTLHKSKRAFGGIRVNVAAYILPRAVADAFMSARVLRADAIISLIVIGYETRLGAHFLTDSIFQGFACNIGNDAASNLSVALDRCKYRGFARSLVTGLPADVGFVTLDNAGELPYRGARAAFYRGSIFRLLRLPPRGGPALAAFG